MFYRLKDGERVYTLSEEDSFSAHPAKFTIEDKFSKERITIKKRFNIPPFNDL
ncbi:Nop10p-like RNA-binding protein [Encephalitozoon intestinalis ATCC 50506]|uniref:H/ACA ribonucleoprotein complex subunit NOP10 n=1 Tax=Encephalitozoon intestinalis (strain ATCC 50506) TaxID=876142 RepID=W8Q202_ENCIT|nr:Nop10p-like RNA-binding protein [Encephalitozoon intestinalis ATCC 50506]AHL30144.1 Nop10p-like RNA-binding protein [Encephalitozoon intestinalis ATCC 50506]UTX45877.1 Nop10p-like RNA-binding protein [Encephalitozoon intestinalis]